MRRGIFALWLLLPGCIDTDAAVFVEASIDAANASLESSALAAGVSGGFRVRFHLGPRANGPSEVSLRGFSLTSADRSEPVLPRLEATTQPAFPLTVPVDGDVEVTASFAAADNLLDPPALAAACQSAGIRIVGVFDDTLRGGSLDAASEPFTPTDCP